MKRAKIICGVALIVIAAFYFAGHLRGATNTGAAYENGTTFTTGDCLSVAAPVGNIFPIVDSGAPCGGASGPAINKIDLTAQAATISYTTILTPSATGTYRASCYIEVTTAATTSSTLPACYVEWNDADTAVTQSIQLTAQETTNTVGTYGYAACAVAPSQGCQTWTFRAGTGGAIRYSAQTYASAGATAMQYSIHFVLEGPF